jgi:hypothetical protein
MVVVGVPEKITYLHNLQIDIQELVEEVESQVLTPLLMV